MKALVFVLALFVVTTTSAQEWYAPEAALNVAKAQNKLPSWFSFDTKMQVKVDIGTYRFYGCFTKSDGTERWATWMDGDSYITLMTTGKWSPKPSVPVTYEDRRYCFPDLPKLPVASGEPAYWNVICKAACTGADPVDWGAMNTAKNIAGATQRGELCGEATTLGFWTMPRLQAAGGLVPVTRCYVPE